jgi:hypothetical protein
VVNQYRTANSLYWRRDRSLLDKALAFVSATFVGRIRGPNRACSIFGFPNAFLFLRGIAMSKNYRLGVVLALTFVIILVADSRIAFAQRINFGGQSSQTNRDKDKDDDDDDEEENRDNNRADRSSKSGNRTQDQINLLLQGKGGQGGESGQAGQGGQAQQGGQGGRGGRGGQGGQGGSGDNDDEYRQGDFHQFGRGGREGQFQQRSQNDFQKLFRPKDNSQNLRIGGWQGDRWQGSRSVKNWGQVFAGGKQPFSSQWHQEHPKAWKYDNNKANIWVNASLPGVYSWLNWGNVPPQYNVGIGNHQHFDLQHYGEWYPLGVYSLMAGPGDMGTRIVQLAIDRHGHIAGNYYDIITDTNSSISGDVRRQSQRAYWSLNKNDSIRFKAPLYRLMQPYGYVTVELPGGEQDWQFVRLEN